MKYIGLDAHSGSSTFVVLGKSGKVLRRERVITQESTLLEFVRSINGSKKLTLEEGTLSQWLYLLLKDEVNELVVCQPPRSQGAKTDYRDALEIADLLRVDRLKPVFHDDSVLMNLRVLISGYGDVIQELTRIKNRYKALYRQVGIKCDGGRFYRSEDKLKLLDTNERHYVGCTLFEQLRLYEEQRLGYLERFEANARSYEPIRLLTSIPGIGPIRANQLVAVIVTPHRFPTKYRLFSYAMLAQHNRISDGKLYGKKRAHGNTVLKDIFKASILPATMSNTAFKRKYSAMRAAGADDKVARNAVAKMIAATVLGVWKSGKKYDDTHWEVTRRRNGGRHRDT